MENKPTEKTLFFKPLSEGLGFHPFSDGLPYAPVTKNTTNKTPTSPGAASSRSIPLPVGPMPDFQRGSGATAAGAASFALPARPNLTSFTALPRVSVPVAPPSLNSPHGSVQAQDKASSAQMSAEFQAELAPANGLGYLAKRSVAYLLDTAFNTGLCAGTFGFALWKQGISPETLIGPSMIFLFVVFLCTFNWAIMTAQEMAFGTTLGKRIFGLALDGSGAAIFLRAFFFLPSAGFLAVGLLWGIFDRRKRCWHDLVVNLQPIEIAQL